jgi:hypothetical protein
VEQENFTGREDSPAQGRLPVDGSHIDFADNVIDFAHHDIDHAIKDVFLIGHVVVQRHGLDPELLAKLAHAE